MKRPIDHVRQIVIPRLRENRLLACCVLAALAASAGFWIWNVRTQVYHLQVGAGVELKYRKDLLKILAEEAQAYDLVFSIEPSHSRSADSIARVARGELDLAVVPAGLAIQEPNVRQVAVLDCEPLQLFVRPGMVSNTVAALKGKRLGLGSEGSGVRFIARDVLEFMGLKPGVDYQDVPFSYMDLGKLSPEQMPDAIFSLSPLPSPMGERLAQQYGYHLVELPFGAAMNLRKPAIEDTVVPAHTYGADPAVPDRPLHTVGTRSVVISNAGVSKIAIRRLLAVLYESDFARRIGVPPLNDSLILRSAEYPNHAGTIAYLHRHDPWVNKDFIDNVTRLRGFAVSIISALLLAWQWLRRRTSSGLNDYLRMCTKLEIDSLRASLRGEFTQEQLADGIRQLNELRVEVLDKHLSGALPGDQQFGMLLARVDSLLRSLPALLNSDRLAVGRKAA